MLGRKLTPAEVGILETFVIPRYLEKFGELTLDMMLTGDYAKIAHLGCRTGYPDRQLIDMIDSCSVTGVDASLAAVELARNKAATLHDVSLEYMVASDYPTELEGDSFSHAMSLHPIGNEHDRLELFREMERVLYVSGQALIALPLRGSFQEIGDLVREYALKNDMGEMGKAMEVALLSRPTIETLSEEMEAVGFDDIDVEVRQINLRFETGRAFIEDPVTRLLIVPDLETQLGVEGFERSISYVADAIDKYWANRTFELNVNVGAASARKG